MKTKEIFGKYKNLPVQVRASFWFLICSFLQRGITVLTTPIFTRILSTSEYGDYSVFNSWLGIVTIFVSLRLYYGVYTQGLVKFDIDRDKFTSSMQGLSFTLFVGWTTIYLVFRGFWNHIFSLTTVQMLAMLVMVWATAAFNFWATEQRVSYSYRKLVIATIIVSLAKPIVGITFVILAKDKVTARILGLALVELIGYTGMFIVQMKRGKSFFSAFYWKYALMFNIPLIPHYLSQTVLNSADRIMIKSMVGSQEAGIYGLAYSVSQIMLLFNQALLQTMTPWVYQKIKNKKTEDISSIAYIALVIIGFVNLVLIAFAPEAIRIFAPASYYDAIWIIPPVALSVYFIFAYSLFASFEFYYEKTKFIATASVLGAVLNIVLNYYGIRIFGYYAAGYTTLICYMVYTVGHYTFMKRICKEQQISSNVYSTKIIVAITTILLLLGFAFLLTYRAPFIRIGLVLLMLIICIIERNKLLSMTKKIYSLRKKR